MQFVFLRLWHRGPRTYRKCFFKVMGSMGARGFLGSGVKECEKIEECEKIVGSRVKECEKIDGPWVMECEKIVGPRGHGMREDCWS